MQMAFRNRMACGLLVLGLTAGCQKAAAPPSPSPSGPQTEDEKTVYAIGAALGHNVTPLSLSPALIEQLKKGVGDAAAGAPPAVDVQGYEPKIRAFIASRQAAQNKPFLEKAAKEEGAVKTASGLVMRTLRAGTGPAPAKTDVAVVEYAGSLMDGTVFDASSRRGKPLAFPLGAAGMIPCFSEGVQRMKVGEKARLVCPPELAYGEQGAPPTIPGNAVLIFDVELTGLNPPRAAQK
jgi:FKBP-type peptidyl-prolyl cis-trans isomerase FkpA